MKKIFWCILMVAVAGFLFGHASAKKGGAKSGVHHSKRELPVSVNYTVPENNESGGTVEVALRLETLSDIDNMSLKIAAEEGLDLLNSSDQMTQFGSVAGGTVLNKNISLWASEDGRLYVNLFVSGEVSGLNATKILSIPVPVGGANQKPLMNMQKTVKDKTGQDLIIMPAEEPGKK